MSNEKFDETETSQKSQRDPESLLSLKIRVSTKYSMTTMFSSLIEASCFFFELHAVYLH